MHHWELVTTAADGTAVTSPLRPGFTVEPPIIY